MKITLVTDDKGTLLASMTGHASLHRKQPGPFGTLRPTAGQVFHEIEVPDDYETLGPDELHRALLEHIPRS